MTQEEKIKELKELNVAYECAQEYDNCPEPSEADEILDILFDYDKYELVAILKKYSGWSCSDIQNTISRKIKLL